jgi:hypothetical protein
MGMDKLWESKKRIDDINSSDAADSSTVPRYRRTSGLRFEERHKRVTTYIHNDLYRELEALREQGKILNLTALYNDALSHYFKTMLNK